MPSAARSGPTRSQMWLLEPRPWSSTAVVAASEPPHSWKCRRNPSTRTKLTAPNTTASDPPPRGGSCGRYGPADTRVGPAALAGWTINRNPHRRTGRGKGNGRRRRSVHAPARLQGAAGQRTRGRAGRKWGRRGTTVCGAPPGRGSPGYHHARDGWARRAEGDQEARPEGAGGHGDRHGPAGHRYGGAARGSQGLRAETVPTGPDAWRVAQATGLRAMRAEFINPFLQAATEVLESELGSRPQRGSIGLQRSAYTSDEVTAVLAVTGGVAGMVMFAMAEDTARAIV